MKKIFFAILILSLVCFVAYKFFNQKEFIRSEKSSDGNYIVEIYKEKSFFATPGDGGISGSMGYIKLLDKNGKEIGNTSNCDVSYGDIEIRWDLPNNYLFYSRGSAINLKTGRCD